MDFNKIREGLNRINAAANALAGENSESVTLRHAGNIETVPYDGNPNVTLKDLFPAAATKLGIPANAQPTAAMPGKGVVDVNEAPVPGGVYDLTTDKKENSVL